jgi:hypothetical protein
MLKNSSIFSIIFLARWITLVIIIGNNNPKGAKKMLHITTGYKKMEGVDSINTPSSTNPFCQKMAKTNTICAKCYAIRNEQYRVNIKGAFARNIPILTNKDFVPSLVNRKVMRFHSYGELINETHFINFIKIALVNKGTFFALWTKRKDIVQRYLRKGGIIPSNMNLIYSTPEIDKGNTKAPKGFDKVFNVFSKEKAESGEININCGGKKCLDCMICYGKNDIEVINEKAK